MSGGGSTTTEKTKTKSSPWEAQVPYIKNLFSGAQNWMDSGGMQAYDGQLVAGQDPNLVAGQQAALQSAQGIGSELIGDANNAWQFALTNAMNPESNPYLKASAQAAGRNVTSQFNEEVLPQMRLNAIAGNNFNSSRSALAEGQAAGKVGQALADLNTNMYSDAYNTGMGTMMSALGMAPGMFQLNQAPANVQMGIGAQNQAYEQALLDAQRAQFQQEQMLPLQNLQAFQGLIGGNYGGTTTGEKKTHTPGPSFMQQALGLGGMALGMVNPLAGAAMGGLSGAMGGGVGNALTSPSAGGQALWGTSTGLPAWLGG